MSNEQTKQKRKTLLEMTQKEIDEAFKTKIFSDLSADEYQQLINEEMVRQKNEQLPKSKNPDYQKAIDKISLMINSYRDLQKLRISQGNRIVGYILIMCGDKRDMSSDKQKDTFLNKLVGEYKRISEYIVTNKLSVNRFFNKEDLLKKNRINFITEKTFYFLMESFSHILQEETTMMKKLQPEIMKHPIHIFQKNTHGMGVIMSAYILRFLNPYLADSPASFWRYCGYDVYNGKGVRLSNKGGYRKRIYIDKHNKINLMETPCFNVILKSRLHVFMTSCVYGRYKNESIYYPVWEEYFNRISNMEVHKNKTELHRKNMALRYAIKRYLTHIWLFLRQVEGLPITNEYHERANQ